ncbi:hypothetical protein [Poseidonocella sp. HB161398]|uniref:hypothetical protein n=1 Tax=Poseidonocella sp. HB161398 TaxID=2320855 RepID=UPI00110802C8|nr:hypothetical protein [Poseidonocella sp. HB161398]
MKLFPRSLPRLAAARPAAAPETQAEPVQAQPAAPARILLHIGGPKTATSTIQRWMNANRRPLRRAGIGLLSPRDLRHAGIFASCTGYVLGRSETPDASALRAALLGTGQAATLASEETLTNFFIPGHSDGRSGFAGIDRLVTYLESMALPELQILLTVRRQDRFLRSSYAHRVKRNGVSLDFGDWLEAQADLEDLSWLGVTELLDAAFGAENVSVVPFEMLEAADDAALYARCLAPLGASAEGHRVPTIRKANAGLGDAALEAVRLLNGLPLRDAAAERERAALIGEIEAFAAEQGDGPARPEMAALTEFCRARYGAENAALAARKFPDLRTSFDFTAT